MANHREFYIGVNISDIWVKDFRSTSAHDLILITLYIAAICFLKTALSAALAVSFDSTSLAKRKAKASKCRRVMCHMLATLSTTIDYCMGYLLMLAFMIGNVWLCITIVLSSTLSYFLTHWCRIRLKQRVGAKNRRRNGDSGVNREDTAETTAFIHKSTDPTQEASTSKPSIEKLPENRQTIAMESPGVPLVSFQNLYDRPVEVESKQVVTTPPPDVIATPTTAAASYPLNSSITKPRSDSNPILEKYPLLKFHNVDVPDTSPSHRAPERGLQLQELDRLIDELQS